MLNGFSKKEKLCNVKEISSLFKGESLFIYPFKLVYTVKENDTTSKAKVLCSVGKRYSKSAVKRNLIKRRIREAYRLNKSIILSKLGNNSINLGFIFIAHKEESYEQIEQSIIKGLNEITKKLQ